VQPGQKYSTQNTENRHTDKKIKKKIFKTYENIKTLGKMHYTYTH